MRIAIKLIGEYDQIEIDYIHQEEKIAALEAKGKKYTFADTINLKVARDGIETIIENPKQWLQGKLFEHLQNIFPNVSVLHKISNKLVVSVGEDKTPIKRYEPLKGMFTFEIKDIYTKARFHGTSNYLLSNSMNTEIKMRSYEKKKHQAFTINGKRETVETKFYESDNPSKFFFTQLDNPNRVIRSKVFKKTGILKLNDWRNNSAKCLNKGYICGDTIEKTGLLREFSISQFTYQTKAQYQAIEKEVQRNKRRYNQSYEGYFLNDDGSLNYQEMIETIDKIIASGAHSINNVLDQSNNRARDLAINHPEAEVYQLVKQQANCESDVDTDASNTDSNLDDILIFDDDDLYDDAF